PLPGTFDISATSTNEAPLCPTTSATSRLRAGLLVFTSAHSLPAASPGKAARAAATEADAQLTPSTTAAPPAAALFGARSFTPAGGGSAGRRGRRQRGAARRAAAPRPAGDPSAGRRPPRERRPPRGRRR